MFKKAVQHAVLALAVAATAVTFVGGTANAAPATAHARTSIVGGRTTVTTGHGIAGVLLSHGILPIVTRPGSEGLRIAGGLAVTASFPVTGGSASLSPLGGTVRHRGGIRFINVHNGKSLTVGDFTIDLSAGDLTGAVNGTSTRVPVFTLDLSGASIAVHGNTVRFTNVGLVLTSTAAGALNASLHTSLFAGGLRFGTAVSTVTL
ncbi:MAG TPA: hypothetical protein VGJ28_17825 [Micromonosporaceae bacterium]|jgi:hypothetical protein